MLYGIVILDLIDVLLSVEKIPIFFTVIVPYRLPTQNVELHIMIFINLYVLIFL